ncbi:4-(cytidine 5'-diphospho)-2-C-methyl-D-erythritol kinase [Corynebacterium sp. sy039]|uniref:4-(cytidine 5'-diphospho)-2-C-methyl-D-erythritol kinase n=1 Tax=Corynebacterium sp. sy039 TaxID=2599641 RepID=UPI0011B3FE48|nr:4-(cytidine 5'-diphospho)-2-C-methyl-D-erythritol kinase [Corynebacterium sp. sy039]QDZ42260.1 4-(cytidine 5'-diphospho)-2-C-methyl-D-erythritol kinase [Corynebacterium sp. sy039]
MHNRSEEKQTSGRTVIAHAHAKVNLHLGVGELRADGYHDLVSVFQSLSLYDELVIESAHGASPCDNTSIISSFEVENLSQGTVANAEVPRDGRNLAWQAVEKLYHWHRDNGGDALQPVCITLRKGIPTAGGMAGGSADAAAALRAFNTFLPTPATEQQLLALAATLGSDVPFTLLGHTQLGTGRGEELTPILTRGTYHWALAFSDTGLSTPKVFAKLDSMQRKPHLDTQQLSAALSAGKITEVAQCLHNDLQAAALSLQPKLRRTLEIGKDAGALAGIVSGSGPTCAFLCADEQTAREVADELRLFGAATVATGAASGAHLLS